MDSVVVERGGLVLGAMVPVYLPGDELDMDVLKRMSCTY
jgi:hypothetical protein